MSEYPGEERRKAVAEYSVEVQVDGRTVVAVFHHRRMLLEVVLRGKNGAVRKVWSFDSNMLAPPPPSLRAREP